MDLATGASNLHAYAFDAWHVYHVQSEQGHGIAQGK